MICKGSIMDQGKVKKRTNFVAVVGSGCIPRPPSELVTFATPLSVFPLCVLQVVALGRNRGILPLFLFHGPYTHRNPLCLGVGFDEVGGPAEG
jgi:hypothetical protein